MTAFPNRILVVALASLWAGGCSDPARPAPAPTEVAPISKPTPPAAPPVPSKPPVAVAPPVAPAPVAIATPGSYREALADGKQARVAGDLDRARAMLEAAVRLDAAGGDAHVELARVYLALGERARAVKAAKKATWLMPSSSLAWNTLGRAELARHKYAEAVTAFEQAVEIAPANAFAWNNLGLTYLLTEQWDEAVVALESAISQDDVAGYMWNNLGLAYEQLDRLDDARLAFEEGAALGSAAAASSRERLEGLVTIVRHTGDRPSDVPAPDAPVELPAADAPVPGADVAPGAGPITPTI